MKPAKIILTVLLIGSFLLTSGQAVLGEDDDTGADDSKKSTEISVEVQNPIKANTLEEVINNIINFVFTIALIVCPLIIIIGGFIFVTAGGDPKKVETGKKMIYYALIGLGVVLLAKGFVEALKQILRVKKEEVELLSPVFLGLRYAQCKAVLALPKINSAAEIIQTRLTTKK